MIAFAEAPPVLTASRRRERDGSSFASPRSDLDELRVRRGLCRGLFTLGRRSRARSRATRRCGCRDASAVIARRGRGSTPYTSSRAVLRGTGDVRFASLAMVFIAWLVTRRRHRARAEPRLARSVDGSLSSRSGNRGLVLSSRCGVAGGSRPRFVRASGSGGRFRSSSRRRRRKAREGRAAKANRKAGHPGSDAGRRWHTWHRATAFPR